MKKLPQDKFRLLQSTILLRLSLLLIVSLASCATIETEEPPVQVVELEPAVIHIKHGNSLYYTIDDLFELAYRDFNDGKYREAAQSYQEIIDLSKDTKYRIPSLYNAALAYEHLGEKEKAATCYRAIIDSNPKEVEAKDAYFRLADLDESLGLWDEEIATMQAVEKREGLELVDRVEAQMRQGWAYLKRDELSQALAFFQKALATNNRAPVSERLLDSSELIARVNYGIGALYHRRILLVRLVLPPERMARDLETKAEYLLSAQNAYIRSLAAHDPTWSIAAGFQIGRLYEDFYNDILAAEIPSGLSSDDLHAYFVELRGKIRPLVERAQRIYKKTIELSKRMGDPLEGESWVSGAKSSVEHMSKYMDDEATQRRLERFVISGKDLQRMFQADGIVDDAIVVASRAAKSVALKRAKIGVAPGK